MLLGRSSCASRELGSNYLGGVYLPTSRIKKPSRKPRSNFKPTRHGLVCAHECARTHARRARTLRKWHTPSSTTTHVKIMKAEAACHVPTLAVSLPVERRRSACSTYPSSKSSGNSSSSPESSDDNAGAAGRAGPLTGEDASFPDVAVGMHDPTAVSAAAACLGVCAPPVSLSSGACKLPPPVAPASSRQGHRSPVCLESLTKLKMRRRCNLSVIPSS